MPTMPKKNILRKRLFNLLISGHKNTMFCSPKITNLLKKHKSMLPTEAQHKIQQLSQELEQHNYNYYVLDHPTISDFEFDKLLEELIALEKQFPEFLSPNSPSQRVG